MSGDPAICCVYCGAEDPETRDHVPPRGLFAPPRPSNLVTVPCCEGCHAGTSDDDEYFRAMLAMRADVFAHPDVQGVLPKVHRSFTKPRKRGFTRALIETMREVEVRTPAGIILGKTGTYHVDLERLSRVVERTVRGLYWRETGTRLEREATVAAFNEDGIVEVNPGLMANVLTVVRNNPERVIGNNTVVYQVSFGDRDGVSAWLLTFYERVRFLVITLPPEREPTG